MQPSFKVKKGMSLTISERRVLINSNSAYIQADIWGGALIVHLLSKGIPLLSILLMLL
jgi:hypothetical protein